MNRDIGKSKWLHLRDKRKHHRSEPTEGDASRRSSHHEYIVRKSHERYDPANQDGMESERALH